MYQAATTKLVWPLVPHPTKHQAPNQTGSGSFKPFLTRVWRDGEWVAIYCERLSVSLPDSSFATQPLPANRRRCAISLRSSTGVLICAMLFERGVSHIKNLIFDAH